MVTGSLEFLLHAQGARCSEALGVLLNFVINIFVALTWQFGAMDCSHLFDVCCLFFWDKKRNTASAVFQGEWRCIMASNDGLIEFFEIFDEF